MRPRSGAELVELMRPGRVELTGETAVVGPDVVIDNREATPGSLFVAIPGERVDGHEFAPAAIDAGSAAVLGTRQTDADVPHLLVDDSVLGLSWLARGLVREARARGMASIGITGSSGKTSTKDLLAQVLESVGATVAPAGSLNNEIGVPLTACRIDDDTQYLVSEMGARGMGHIQWLTSLVGLDVAVVLNVGSAHVGEFGGIEQTAIAKGEIVADLAPDGWAVLNGNDPSTVGMRDRTRGRLAWFGEGELPVGDLHVLARNVEVNGLGQPGFDLVVLRGEESVTAPVQLSVIGRHQVSNALAAAAAAVAVGVEVGAVAAGLSEAVRRSSWRMELGERGDGVLVLNDAYNANPDSMAAALRTAAELVQFQRGTYPEARVVAVLGDMLELGPMAADAHATLGRLAADLRVSEVIAVGEFADAVAGAAEQEGLEARTAHRDDVADLLDLHAGDVVLIKGSRGVGLEVVASQLLAAEVLAR